MKTAFPGAHLLCNYQEFLNPLWIRKLIHEFEVVFSNRTSSCYFCFLCHLQRQWSQSPWTPIGGAVGRPGGVARSQHCRNGQPELFLALPAPWEGGISKMEEVTLLSQSLMGQERVFLPVQVLPCIIFLIYWPDDLSLMRCRWDPKSLLFSEFLGILKKEIFLPESFDLRNKVLSRRGWAASELS